MTKLTHKPSKSIQPKVIKTTKDYERALARVEDLFAAKPNTPEGDELELWLLLVETYENKNFPIGLPNPIEAIRFRMEQANLKQKDLIPLLGSKGKVSEVLSGKRELSLTMIRKLVNELGIPASVLLQEPGAKLDDGNFLKLGKKFPIAEMHKRGWLKGIVGSLQDAKDQIEDVLAKFMAPVGDPTKHPVLNRQSVRCGSKMDNGALTAWQIRVMSEALSEKLPIYQSGTVDEEFLSQVAKLSYFCNGPQLAMEFLRKNGIHLIVERHLPKTFLDGAAMRLGENGRLVAMTLRYDRLDNFWFVLLHELAHIALHIDTGECDSIVDDLDGASTEKIEREADLLAIESLIPSPLWKKEKLTTNVSSERICAFAEKLRIHPAIPAGRVRYELKDFKKFNNLLGTGSVRSQFE
jgi:HTH-type transcriptional regulator / antitoxin HigA